MLLAAGRGERLGGVTPKAFVRLAEVPLLLRSLETLLEIRGLDHIQPVIAEQDWSRYGELTLPEDSRVARPVPGGKLRQDSVAAGLEALPAEVRWVAVHDAARCLVTAAEVEKVLEVGRESGAAILASPARDTIKRARSGIVEETPLRSDCWIAQTPQVFERDLLARALDRAQSDGFVGTDDSQLVERLGVRVRVVEGLAHNIKITLPEDLLLAESLLAREST